MIRWDSIHEAGDAVAEWRRERQRVIWVPTAGALHEGHRAQIAKAWGMGDRVLVSAFVDPKEFASNEDYHSYPRKPEQDQEMCRECGVDGLVVPSAEVVYPPGFSTYVQEERVSAGLCGISRPHHFRGVATGFMKLYSVLRPDGVAFYGHERQRAGVLKRVIRDFQLPLQVEMSTVVRDKDGLPWDARNEYLNASQRMDATRIHRALRAGKHVFDQGNHSVDRIMAEVTNQMLISRRLHVLYVSIVDTDSLDEVREIVPGKTILCTSVMIDQIRLIDHLEF